MNNDHVNHTGLGRSDFSNYLMECWYKGYVGDWAKDLAINIQTEKFNEYLD